MSRAARPGEDPAEEYALLQCIGHGSFGDVYKGVDKKSGEVVAVKVIDLEEADEEIEDIQREITMQSQCDSPQLTRYHTSFISGSKLWIVMEYLCGGSVRDLLEEAPLEEPFIAVILREMLRGLQYLHDEGKIHRDIKAANVLLGGAGEVKLADFGVAGQVTATMSKRQTFVGTPFWMAPEVIVQSRYDCSADIWSLGVTAMEMAKGAPPYASIHPMRVLFLIPKNDPPTLEGAFSKPFKEFVALCLQRDAGKRPTAAQLLKHRFVRGARRNAVLTELLERRAAFLAARDGGAGGAGGSAGADDARSTSGESRSPARASRSPGSSRSSGDADDDSWTFTVKPGSLLADGGGGGTVRHMPAPDGGGTGTVVRAPAALATAAAAAAAAASTSPRAACTTPDRRAVAAAAAATGDDDGTGAAGTRRAGRLPAPDAAAWLLPGDDRLPVLPRVVYPALAHVMAGCAHDDAAREALTVIKAGFDALGRADDDALRRAAEGSMTASDGSSSHVHDLLAYLLAFTARAEHAGIRGLLAEPTVAPTVADTARAAAGRAGDTSDSNGDVGGDEEEEDDDDDAVEL